jgi:hypothetical protein
VADGQRAVEPPERDTLEVLMVMRQVRKTERWMMIRVTAETHRRFAALHEKREAARSRGQVTCDSDRVTQNDVMTYLLDGHESLQERRRRSRIRRRTRRSPSSERSSCTTSLYTGANDPSGSSMEDNSDVCK